jgi:UPF0755 protein
MRYFRVGILTLLFAFPIASGFFIYTYLTYLLFEPKDINESNNIIFEIPKTWSTKKIATELAAKGLIREWWSFYYLSRLTNKDKEIRFGEYELSASKSVSEILQQVTAGDIIRRVVTLREGITLSEIPKEFLKSGLITESSSFEKILGDEILRRKLQLPHEATSFEGYLFPETYHFSKPLDLENAIEKLHQEWRRAFYPIYTDEVKKRLSISLHQIITMASIIEKESGNFAEQPKIASVFYNRLSLGMPLQSDPTVIYGVLLNLAPGLTYDGNLKRIHLTTPTSYNTYTSPKLPPGPICNPGKSALLAALKPESTNYLYFVADGKGNHIFSTNLRDHNAAVFLYQK